MPTSGTYTYNPDTLDLVDDAYERCGIDPANLTARHLTSAKRSLNLLFSEWESRGVHNFLVDQETATLAQGDTSFSLPSGTIDIISAFLRRDGIDTPLQRIGRLEYEAIPDKDQQGRPTVFFIDRLIAPVFKFWLAAENSTDVIIYDRIMKFEDVTTLQATYTTGVTKMYTEAMVAGLAAKLSWKFAPDRVNALSNEAERTFKLAYGEDRERADTTFEIRSGRR